jgi:hypothetical protein
MRSECHAPPQNSERARGTRSTRYRRSSRLSERVQLPLEVRTLDVVAPLALALDGVAVVFPIVIVVEFGPVVGHSDTCGWYKRRRWCASSQRRSRG